jgi:hypothetical protein
MRRTSMLIERCVQIISHGQDLTFFCVAHAFSQIIQLESSSNPSWRSNASPLHSPKSVFGVCRFFIEGKCNKGEDCPFTHDRPTALQSKETPAPAEQKQRRMSFPGQPSPISCKYFSSGLCAKGQACPFTHAPKSRSHSDVPSPLETLPKPNPPLVQCKFALSGHCNRGDQCGFFHPKNVNRPQHTTTIDKIPLPMVLEVCFLPLTQLQWLM